MKKKPRYTLTTLAALLLIPGPLLHLGYTQDEQTQAERRSTVDDADRLEGRAATLPESAAVMKSVTLKGLHPFELGKRISFQEIRHEEFPEVDSLLFSFDLADPSSQYNHHVMLTAELELSRFNVSTMVDRRLLLTFLDRRGLPIQTHYAFLTTAPNDKKSPEEMVENLRKHNATWLVPSHQDKYSYVFRRDGTAKHISVAGDTDLSQRQAFTLSTSFGDLLGSPGKYRMPVRFEGLLDGKPVVYADFFGESFKNQCGNGFSSVGWHGYMSFFILRGLVLYEKDTWRPLVTRVGPLEIQYRDYVEIEPGVSVPLRIVIFYDNKSGTWCDFRFKVLDGKLWLLDRAYRDGKVAARTEQVTWADGRLATTTARSAEDETPQEEPKPFDFRRITQRRASAARGSTVLREIMAQPRPWEYPGYDSLLKTVVSTAKQDGAARVCMNLVSASQLKDASFFTLTWLKPDGTFCAIPGPHRVRTLAYVLPAGKSSKFKTYSGSNLPASGMLSIALKEEPSSYEAKIAVSDDSKYKGFSADLSLAIADPNGAIVSGGWRNFSFTNWQKTHSSEQVLHLGRVGKTQQLLLIPRFHKEVCARLIGSTLGTIYDPYKPPLSWKQIFSAEDSRVWGYGLRFLQKNVNDGLCRFVGWGFPPDALENDLRDRLLAPHKDVLMRLLKTTKEPEYLVILAQLAGHMGDARFRELLLPLLDHSEKKVREAAAIHLCRLGDARGLKLTLATLRHELHDVSKSTDHSQISPQLVETLMGLYLLDTDEAITPLGETLLSWLKRPFNDREFSYCDRTGSKAAVMLMLEILGHSKRPQAIEYLCRAIRDESRANVQEAILRQLQRHTDNDEVRRTIVAGIRKGRSNYFLRAPRRPEVVEVVAKKLLDPTLKKDAFSAAVTYLTYAKGPRARDALQQAYKEKLHADNPELRNAVLCGLAHHGDWQHLPEAFDLLVKVVEQPPLSSTDKKAVYERKRQIDQIGGSAHGIPRHFPPKVVARFLHTKDAQKRHAVREAIQVLLDASPEIAMAYKETP